MKAAISTRFRAALERAFPEKRLFLKSETETRFVRLKPGTQLIAVAGSAAITGWAIIASAILLMDSLGSGNLREQARREQLVYEERLNALSAERDSHIREAREAHERFSTALAQVSEMQTALLASEDRRQELEVGIEVIQKTLRRTIRERDAARTEAATLLARLEDSGQGSGDGPAGDALVSTVDFLSDALADTAQQRDAQSERVAAAEARAHELLLENRLMAERTERVFSQLEDAVSVSLAPLDKMFAKAGMPADRIIEVMRRSYSGQGGPLTPLTFSTKGEAPDPLHERANGILGKLDEVNLYRMALERTPFAEPTRSAVRYTSGYGYRRDPKTGGRRMHNGSDFAGALGTPIYATADGTVIHAGRSSGYGKLIKIQHEFGIQTYYAHLSKIRVKKGQRVSQGDRIGDMGNTGRSTGVHLHYEVRIGGKPVNPMSFIKAARDVF